MASILIAVLAVSLVLFTAIWVRNRDRSKQAPKAASDPQEIADPLGLCTAAERVSIKDRTADLLSTDQDENMLANDNSDELEAPPRIPRAR